MDGTTRGALPPKLYFRIGEVASLVGVEPHVLRYWEREFRTIRPSKSAKGQRVYSRRDVESLLRVRELLYAEGFTIAGAKKKLSRAGAASETQGTIEASAPSAATAPSPEPQREEPPARAAEPPVDAKLRSELLAIRDELSAFLSELGG